MKYSSYLFIFFSILSCQTKPPISPTESELEEIFSQIPVSLKNVFTSATKESCTEFAILTQGEINLENNTWNAVNLTSNSYQQCIYQYQNNAESMMGWKWSYPNTATEINAYPQIIYGKKPWHSNSTTLNLPKVISSINQLKVNYEIDIFKNDGGYNLAFDNWLCSSAKSTPNDIQFEFMIWEDYHLIEPFGDYIDTVTTLNGSYKLYTGVPTWAPEGTSWLYIAFVRTVPRKKGTVDIDILLQYLVDKDIVPQESYFSSLEFGTELGNSIGYAILKNFEVSLN